MDEHGVLIDFTDLSGAVELPTPEECRAGKPNALGWWAPNENGAMFNGFYLDGLILRALATGEAEDRAKARRLVEGLLRLASCSEVPGFIGRGFGTDGKTTWPMGSNDQTIPWFYGLWRYLQSGLADQEEPALRKRIVEKFTEVANVLVETGWRMPAEPPFHFRGSFAQFSWEGAPRLLFVCKAMHQLTGDAAWDARYRAALDESQDPANADSSPTRLQICERGMHFEAKPDGKIHRATWTGASSAISLRGLWEMEDDPDLRAAYARGLNATAREAAKGMTQRHDFDPDADLYYEPDWKQINALWKPQQTEQDAVDLAHLQIKEINRLSPARRAELGTAREPIFAAWVTTLSPDAGLVKEYEAEILATIAHFKADKMYFVSFFPLENAWWRVQTVKES